MPRPIPSPLASVSRKRSSPFFLCPGSHRTHSPAHSENSDKSVFLSGSEGLETALRRAELLVNNKNETVSGHKTWHFSFRTDPARPLNYSHEYLLAFHEAADYQADFWTVKVGAEMEGPAVADQVLRVEGYKWDVPVKKFFRAPLTDGVWHNMGIDLDFDKKCVHLITLSSNYLPTFKILTLRYPA